MSYYNEEISKYQIRTHYWFSNFLIKGETLVGPNPKICNLIEAYEKSTSDILWILDSNVSLNCYALLTAVSIMKNSQIGLVHHIPVAVHISTLGGFLDAVYLNSLHARMFICFIIGIMQSIMLEL
jgi:ceramide glucosyltransferase